MFIDFYAKDIKKLKGKCHNVPTLYYLSDDKEIKHITKIREETKQRKLEKQRENREWYDYE